MYSIAGNLSKGLVVFRHYIYGSQIWSLAKLRSRKNDKCAICGVVVGTIAYRPITNRKNRSARICIKHIAPRGRNKR